MNTKATISVVIPNWNGKQLLKTNLPHLIKEMENYGGDNEIIIVDDASTDGSPKFIRDTYPFVRVLELKQRQGFPIAANQGVAESKYDMVLLLNSDMIVDKGFLSPLLNYFDDEKTFAVSNKAMKDENTPLTRPHIMDFKWGFFRESYISRKNDASFAFGASGGHGLFDRRKFILLGGFDELYSPFYYEDADLSYRAWKRGYRVYFEPNSIVYHEHQASIGKAFSTAYIRFISKRNNFIFLWKNLTDFDLLFQHVIFLPFFLLLNSVRNPLLFLSLLGALIRLPLILKARKKEKGFVRYGDRDILALMKRRL